MSPPPKPSSPSSDNCVLELGRAPRLALLVAAMVLLLPAAVLLDGRAGAPAVVVTAVLAALGAWPAWRALWPRHASRAVRRLRWSAAGEFQLERGDGSRVAVRLAEGSLVRGPWLVLVAEGAAGRERLVIETAALAAPARASLARVLARAAAGPAHSRHALRSLLQQGGPLP